jgi:SAM-dependent methyltransferase
VAVQSSIRLWRAAPPLEALAERIEGRLAAVRADDDVAAYRVKAWQRTIAALLDREPPPGEETDSLRFPYVPIPPEQFGVDLGAHSAVLDVGCLAGHGLFDFYVGRCRLRLPIPRLFGIDLDRGSVRLADELAPLWAPERTVDFMAGRCEELPYEDGAFDLVVARVVFPYVDLSRATAELARVARPGGLALIQLHAPRYYLEKLLRNLHRPLTISHCGRGLLSGLAYTLSGRQPENRWFRETPLGVDQFTALAAGHGFTLRWLCRHPRRPLLLLQRR